MVKLKRLRACHVPSRLNLLLFDMDGVLIDVTKSYRGAIEKTVHLYLTTCLGLIIPKKLRLDEAISLFKSAGGFNNDWDLTSGMLLYLLSVSGLPPSSIGKRCASIPEILAHIKKKAKGFSGKNTIHLNTRDLSSFLRKVQASGGGLKGVRHVLTNSWEGWVFRSGALDQGNLVKRIFQEVYLGKKFNGYYQLQPLFYRGRGYYLRERLLIPRSVLSVLRKELRLGIASGRPRFEAELALKRFHLLSYFDSVVTLDECMDEEDRVFRSTGKRIKYSKPHPYPLLRAIHDINIPRPQCGYVGDVVDDILAAKAAKKTFSILAIGFISGPKNRTMERTLIQAGADRIIRSPKELLSLMSRKASVN